MRLVQSEGRAPYILLAAGSLVALLALMLLAVVTPPEAPAPSGSDPNRAVPAASDQNPSSPSPRQSVTPTARPTKIPVHGRIVAAEDNLLLPECTVTLIAGAQTHISRSGTVDIQLDPVTEPIQVSVTAPGRIPLRGTIQPSAAINLGVLALRRGTRVIGQLRDTASLPVPNAEVRVTTLTAQAAGPLSEPVSASARTDASGRFTLTHFVPSGPAHVSLFRSPPLASSREVVIGSGPDFELSLTCAPFRAEDRISGTVVDPGGRPLGGMIVTARSGAATALATTDDGGRFALFRTPRLSTAKRVRLSVSRAKGGFVSEHPDACAWGQQDVRVMFDRGCTMVVAVRAAGAPVTQFALQCVPLVGVRRPNDARWRTDGAHPTGEFRIDGLASGAHLLLAHPRGAFVDRYASTLPITVEVAPGMPTVVAELPVQATRTVTVTAQRGRVSGSVVEVLALHGTDRLDAATLVTDLNRFMMERTSREPFAVRVARGVTDRSGEVKLELPASLRTAAMRVTGTHVPFATDSMAVDPRITVRVDRGHAVAGQLVPQSLLHHLHSDKGTAQVVLALRDGDADHVVPLAADGRFSAPALPAGTYEVYLRRFGPRGLREELPGPLGVVRAGPGAVATPELSIATVAAPGSVSVQVRGAAPNQSVQLVYRDRRGVRRVGAQGRTSSDGRCTLLDVAARTYHVRVRPPTGGKWHVHPNRIRLSAGRRESVVIEPKSR